MSVNVVCCSEVFRGVHLGSEEGIRVEVNPLGKMSAAIKLSCLWSYESITQSIVGMSSTKGLIG